MTVQYNDDDDSDELMFICIGKRTYLELLAVARKTQQSVAQLVARALQKELLQYRVTPRADDKDQ